MMISYNFLQSCLLIEEIRLMWGIDIKLFDENIVVKFNSGPSDPGEKPQEEETQPPAEYLENYPGELYCNNQRWDSSERSDYPMRIKPFVNVFEDGEYKYDDLFRRFTRDEVNLIVRKLNNIQCESPLHSNQGQWTLV